MQTPIAHAPRPPLTKEGFRHSESIDCVSPDTLTGFSIGDRKWSFGILAFAVAAIIMWILIPLAQNSGQNQLLEQLLTTDKSKVRKFSQKGEHVVFEMLPEEGLRGTGVEHEFPLKMYKETKARLDKAQEELRISQRLPLGTKVKLTFDRINLPKGVRSGMIGTITTYLNDSYPTDYDYFVPINDMRLPEGTGSCLVYKHEVTVMK